MEKSKLQEFAARVTQANRSELVVVIYEAVLASIAEGKRCLTEEQVEEARLEISRARSLITELMGSLDMQYGISHYLRQLYIFAYHELCHGIAMRQPNFLTTLPIYLRNCCRRFRKWQNRMIRKRLCKMFRQFMPVLHMDGEL